MQISILVARLGQRGADYTWQALQNERMIITGKLKSRRENFPTILIRKAEAALGLPHALFSIECGKQLLQGGSALRWRWCEQALLLQYRQQLSRGDFLAADDFNVAGFKFDVD